MKKIHLKLLIMGMLSMMACKKGEPKEPLEPKSNPNQKTTYVLTLKVFSKGNFTNASTISYRKNKDNFITEALDSSALLKEWTKDINVETGDSFMLKVDGKSSGSRKIILNARTNPIGIYRNKEINQTFSDTISLPFNFSIDDVMP